MEFQIDEKETKKLNDWLKEHNKKCVFKDPANQGAIGGRLTYSFTPTGLGCVIKITCACGENVDVTDYNAW